MGEAVCSLVYEIDLIGVLLENREKKQCQVVYDPRFEFAPTDRPRLTSIGLLQAICKENAVWLCRHIVNETENRVRDVG